MALDLITLGRSSVDLYGGQVGGRLEDMRSFDKYVGGSPTNIAIGAARLGLKSALITRVGDEHMGRFVRQTLASEGVDTTAVITDPSRLTALVLLGIRDKEQFPLIFYREDCADMALNEADIDPSFIASAKCLTVTGTHLSNKNTAAAVLKALNIARQQGVQTAFDIDYRPNLWGLSGHSDGENRFIASQSVTQKLQSTLHLFDLIVGTEEEFHIAGGSTNTITALQAVRQVSKATLVCKRGPMGAAAFTGEIGTRFDNGISGPGFPVEVFNVLGAGDGFMAGLLKGWLTDQDWQTSMKFANACGAFAVSRHGCAPAYPSLIELNHFLEHGSQTHALRHDTELEQLHWSTNRGKHWPVLRAFAFDHRAQLETIADQFNAPHSRIDEFKQLCLSAVHRAVETRSNKSGYGILCDERLGSTALHAAAGTSLWIGRPVEKPGAFPLELEIGEDYGSALSSWPSEHVVKVLCNLHPDHSDDIQQAQISVLSRLARAARANRLEFLCEIVPPKDLQTDAHTIASAIRPLYDQHIYPDWWKLPSMSDQAWEHTLRCIDDYDPHCRGIIVLGLGADIESLARDLTRAANHQLVKGFAVGRTIFHEAAKDWFAGEITDEQAIIHMGMRYTILCDVWDRERGLIEDETL